MAICQKRLFRINGANYKNTTKVYVWCLPAFLLTREEQLENDAFIIPFKWSVMLYVHIYLPC